FNVSSEWGRERRSLFLMSIYSRFSNRSKILGKHVKLLYPNNNFFNVLMLPIVVGNSENLFISNSRTSKDFSLKMKSGIKSKLLSARHTLLTFLRYFKVDGKS